MLSEREVALLRQWIEEGAEWSDHWAFVAPKRPQVPAAPEGLSPIDAFVRDRLAAEGLSPAPEAESRRVAAEGQLRPHRLAARAGGDRCLSRRPGRRRPRTGGRSFARLSAFRRTLGRRVDGSGAVCRHERIRKGSPPRHVAMARLAHPFAQREPCPTTEMVTDIMAGDLIPEGEARSETRHGLPSQHPGQQRRAAPTTRSSGRFATLDRIATTWAAFLRHQLQLRAMPHPSLRPHPPRGILTSSSPSSTTPRDADLNDDFPKLRVPARDGDFAKRRMHCKTS
jgi:hypothetical protein